MIVSFRRIIFPKLNIRQLWSSSSKIEPSQKYLHGCCLSSRVRGKSVRPSGNVFSTQTLCAQPCEDGSCVVGTKRTAFPRSGRSVECSNAFEFSLNKEGDLFNLYQSITVEPSAKSIRSSPKNGFFLCYKQASECKAYNSNLCWIFTNDYFQYNLGLLGSSITSVYSPLRWPGFIAVFHHLKRFTVTGAVMCCPANLIVKWQR